MTDSTISDDPYQREPSAGEGAIPGLIYSVSDLTREVRGLLETHYPTVWVQGEISNLARPASGHVYFSIKDSTAQIRCAMFRRAASRLGFRPDDGQEVLVKASVGLYEARGDFQLIVEGMEPAGEGALRLRFEELKAKLDREGLFATDLKQELPAYPQRIGVITSATGAALRDILSVLKRRAPGIRVIVYPCLVQGDAAAASIVAALERAYRRAECDVLIVARGGGSLEDLWPFNEESVARKIVDAPLPIVAGVGHEVDITIADLVADVRAPTPSAAAELCSRQHEVLMGRLSYFDERLMQSMDRFFASHRERIERLALHLGDPRHVIGGVKQQVLLLQERLMSLTQQRMSLALLKSQELGHRLAGQNPVRGIRDKQIRRAEYRERLIGAITRYHARKHLELTAIENKLSAYSPEQTLERGYAIVFKEPERGIVRSQAEVTTGTTVSVRVKDGEFKADVN